MNAQAKKEEVLLPATMPHTGMALTPMDMLDRAITQGAGIEVLTKLMDLQDRWDKNRNRKSFDKAIAAAKAEIKPIVRNREGHQNKKYADFAAIATAVDPIISKYGLSYRFRTKQDEKINVTCILSHDDGHYEENTLSGPPDTTGSKNAIQAIGSTLQYLQRYSLVQALGLAAANDDDGAAAGAGELLTDEQVEAIRSLIVEVNANIALFCKYMKVPKIEDIPASRFKNAIDALEAKRAKS